MGIGTSAARAIEAGRRSGAFTLAAMLVVPVAMRAALLSRKAIEAGLPDARGFVSDLGVSAAVALLAVLLARISRVSAWLVLLGWLAANHGNFEHVAFLGSFADLTYAAYLGDSTFLLGSALAPSSPGVLAAAALASAGLLLLGDSGHRARKRLSAGVAALALSASLAVPLRDEAVLWRQAHCVQLNLGRLLQGGRARVEAAALPHPDLDGAPVVRLPRPGSNVLLVVLESVSGAYLPSVAADHGIAYAVKMPLLDAWAARGLLFTSFVSQQRQTNRGEYALLCGDHPRLLTDEAKMSAYVRDGTRECLPQILRSAGYQTVYLQAASLAFMLKDQFMPRIGFAQTLGASALPRAYARSEWGVDDRAFFEQASDRIEELRRGDRPWFLTLLTVGTHHPFLVPADFEGPSPEQEQERAFAYLDRALGELLARLEASGALADTLVIVTSDESAGLTKGFDDATRGLSQSWSVLAARLPTGESARVAEVFVQSDVAVSILDYLGLAERGEHLTGRSLFRRYDEPRSVYFANTYLRQTHALETGGRLLSCREDFYGCSTWRLEPGRLFAPRARGEPAGKAEVERLRAMVEQSLGTGERSATRLELITEHEVEVSDESRYQIVFAGQYLSAAPGTRIEVELELEIAGGEGEVRLTHELQSLQGRHFGRWLQGLKPGDAARWHYRFTAPERLEKLESRLLVARAAGGGLRLEIKEARLTLSPPEPGAKAGLELRVDEVRRAAARP